MNKKIVSVLSAVMAVAISCGGCTKKQTETVTENGTPEIKYWCSLYGNAATVLSNYGDMGMYKKAQELAGVNVKFLHPPTGQAVEQFNLMVASKDLPDIIEYSFLASYPGGPQKAISDGIIVKLNDYLDNAPDFKNLLDTKEEVKRQAMTDDGTLYAFPSVSFEISVSSGPMIRQDWLDDLGLERPETIDEWETVLTAFKNEKNAATPLTGDKGIIFGKQVLTGAFGVDPAYYVENGKIKYGPIEDNYKDFLAKMADWYKKGLIDPDVFANNSTAVNANVTSGKAGIVYGGIGAAMGTYLNAAGTDEGFKISGIQYPVLKKGDKPQFKEYSWPVKTSGMASISTKNKYPEKSAEFMNVFYSDAGIMLKNFGIEGESYTMQDGIPTYTDLILKNPDGLSISQALCKYTRASAPSPGVAHKEYANQYYQYDAQKEARTLWNSDLEDVQKHTLPPITATVEESEELSEIKTNVETYVEEEVTKIIRGISPVEKYDEVVENIKKMNIDRAIEIYQAAYDRYNKR